MLLWAIRAISSILILFSPCTYLPASHTIYITTQIRHSHLLRIIGRMLRAIVLSHTFICSVTLSQYKMTEMQIKSESHRNQVLNDFRVYCENISLYFSIFTQTHAAEPYKSAISQYIPNQNFFTLQINSSQVKMASSSSTIFLFLVILTMFKGI